MLLKQIVTQKEDAMTYPDREERRENREKAQKRKRLE